MTLKKLINFFLFYKWKFLCKENHFLLFDGSGKAIKNLKSIIPNKKFAVLYNRGEEINISVLIRTILINGFIDISYNYVVEYIKKTKPKVIITFVDTHAGFYKLKKVFPEKKFIVIQSGTKGKKNFKELKLSPKKNEVDYYFTMNKFLSKYLKKKIKAKYITIGSFKANQIKLANYSKKEILFISKQSDVYKDPVPYHELLIIDLFSNYLKKKKNIKLHILLKHNIEKQYKDYLYDKNIKNIKIIYPQSDDVFISYKICQKYKLIINTDSTLGYEMLSLRKKVIFVNYGSLENSRWIKHNGYPVVPFGFPCKYIGNNGFFWTNFFNKNNLIKMFERNYSMESLKWYRKNSKIISLIAPRNENNQIVFDHIR